MALSEGEIRRYEKAKLLKSLRKTVNQTTDEFMAELQPHTPSWTNIHQERNRLVKAMNEVIDSLEQ